MSQETQIYKPKNPIRAVTATALFDGHDASINIFRRMLQASGVEVIHLGHNRSVREIVDTAIQEDVQGLAVSSYQGGHIEFFQYMIDLLRQAHADHIRVFGGGGGVIVPEEIEALENYGVARIYAPEDGAQMGLQGIINHMVKAMDYSRMPQKTTVDLDILDTQNKLCVANLVTAVELSESEGDGHSADLRSTIVEKSKDAKAPVIGITGTGGSGKSSLTDELILRLLNDFKELKVAIFSADPSRRKTGGALLGDRIRMNAIDNPRIYMRSLATRSSRTEIPSALGGAVAVARAAGYDVIIVETAGIGQGDSSIVDLVDISIYVMTSEFGAASQLEKIDMLDYADLIAVNKFEKRGSEDAVRDVRKQVQRNRNAFDKPTEAMPVFGTIAAKFNDDGVSALYHALLARLRENTGDPWKSGRPVPPDKTSTSKTIVVPSQRTRYLSEIAQTVRRYHHQTHQQMQALRRAWHLSESARVLTQSASVTREDLLVRLQSEAEKADSAVDPGAQRLIADWENIRARYDQQELVYKVRGKEIRTPLFYESLSHQKIPKIALPRMDDPGALYRWLRREHLPGYFPYTAGVFPLKRMGEDPTRMFAGEGDPARTNRRFKMLSSNSKAKRLSTAFDSVTLYGFNPDSRPDIYGKVGNAGVSVCTLEDVKTLYEGFDLCAASTSVSMTINGPAPIVLAMYLNTAIDQQTDQFEVQHGRHPDDREYAQLRADTLSTVRGTVQADILKEDQGQNTCIFAIDFALKMMGDIQQYFIEHDVRNFYSVSISGYHIAEAGANPISQLAFTLANGFTYLEYYLSRGMDIDRFGPNLSFFFSNGMDPEYTVIGRVARRIWAIALKEKYGASPRAQMLKYHIQTSGRSLHSRDIQFNDIRTTLQALCAIYDNAQSLHTNAFDEAITTPTEESVRRALAIQLIINREWGLAKNENPMQGSFIVDELTDLVEEAVLTEFDRLSERGGVLGAMETGYQRGKIQEESIHYEVLKHTGDLPIVGVNTFRDPSCPDDMLSGDFSIELARSTEEEKVSQLERLADFHRCNADLAPEALIRLKQVVLNNGNIFAELMAAVRCCSLGQITRALYDVGGKYRRNM